MTHMTSHRLLSFLSLTWLLALLLMTAPSLAQSKLIAQTNPKPMPLIKKDQAITATVRPPQEKKRDVVIGVLAPLSGQDAQFGNAILNATQMALFDIAPSHIKIAPQDTALADGALGAAKRALDGGANIIIGPVSAIETASIKPLLAEKKIPLLALSGDDRLADAHSFMMVGSPLLNTLRIISYIRNQGAQNFAALIPDNNYGLMMRDIFEKTVTSLGGNIVWIGTFNASNRNQKVQNLNMFEGKIDALFLPFAGDNLIFVSRQIRNYDFIFGSDLWDNLPIDTIAPDLRGRALYATIPQDKDNFEMRYQATYQAMPPKLARLAYDTSSFIILTTIENNGLTLNGLKNPRGFLGLNGLFRLWPNGLVEHGLTINRVWDNDGEVIDPAPVAFTSTP